MGIKLGKKVGEGGCSEVFELLDDQSKLVKIARDNTDYEAMKREYNNSIIAWNCNLSVAKAIDFLELDGRHGIVFERIYGETLMERFLKKAFIPSDSSNEGNGSEIRMIARILYEIHSKSNVSQLPSQRDNIKNAIRCVGYLTLDEKETIISILDTLPGKQVLCHGDPNPGNIIVKNDGTRVVIDWMNASIGNPEADLAEFIIMIKYAILPPDLPSKVTEFFNAVRENIIDVFMEEYSKLSGITYNEVDPWLLPVAARKLSADAISDDEKNLLTQEIRKRLITYKKS